MAERQSSTETKFGPNERAANKEILAKKFEAEHPPKSVEAENLADRRREVESIRQSSPESAGLAEQLADDDQPEAETYITKADKNRAYNLSLKRVQRQLGAPGRSFSRLIHNPAVERVSETLEKTIARPSAVLGGSLFATVGLAIMLYAARRNGFALSGSELALFLAIGWLVGLLSELLWRKILKR